VDEGDVAGLHRIEVGREVAGGESLHHHRGRSAVVDRVGNRHERGGRDSDPLRIASGRIDPGYALAGCDALDAVAHRHDPADAFDAEDLGVGRIGPGHALPHADVHEVDAREGDIDQRLARTRHRVRALDMLQHLTAPSAVHNDRFHRLAPYLNDRSVIGQKRGASAAP
jgi:hypothetical protein